VSVAPDGLDRGITRRAKLAEAILWVESVAAAFWPAVTMAAAFVVLALLGLPPLLPGLLHLLLLIGFGATLFLLIARGIRRVAGPGPKAGLRRLERDSHLAHRPFETLVDRPAGDTTPLTTQLWRLHQERRRAAIGRLRLAAPHPDLPRRDPWALRLLVLIALALSLITAGPRSGRLLVAALSPSISFSDSDVPVEAWIKPPAYTGLAPIILRAGNDQVIQVPTGSTAEIHVTDGSRPPRLTLGDVREDFRPLPGGGFAVQQVITQAGTLKVRRGWSTLADWSIAIIPDHPPTIAFAAPPSATDAGALKIDYRAHDDYGVAGVELHIRLAEDRPDIFADPISATLASGQAEKDSRGSSFQDFTGHPWAGMKVLAKLVATDGAGQKGESEEVALILPERHFSNRVAQAIVIERKHIILNDAPRFASTARLSRLVQHPEFYNGDYGVFLGLDTAVMELRQSRPQEREATLRIEKLLWDIALKIEDGNRPEADKELREAEEELEKALKDPNTPASEIARLTQKLKDAMNRDLKAMAENLERQMQNGEQPPQPDPNAQVIDQKDLESQIDKMQQMAQEGSRDAAKDMLDYIKSLLENMRTAQQSGKATEQGRKALQKLKDMAKKQRDMEGQQGSDAAQEQEALRQSLGDAAREIGDSMGSIPHSMSNADRAMRNATKSLQRGVKGGAKADQEEAAGQLDDAAQSLADQLSQAESMMKGTGNGDRDPLGRAHQDLGTYVKVPTDREMQHSREILDELRRRASERERPRFELDYLKRLLQQY
jgi:uncharacterized protein (TIGR02302 family)